MKGLVKIAQKKLAFTNINMISIGVLLTASLSGCAGNLYSHTKPGKIISNTEAKIAKNFFENSVENQVMANIYADNPYLKGSSRIQILSFNDEILAFGEVQNEQSITDVNQTVLKFLYRNPSISQFYNALVVGNTARSYGLTPYEKNVLFTIKDNLSKRAELANAQIKLANNDGRIYVLGMATAEQSDLLTNIIQSVEGVRSVENFVKIVSYPILLNNQPSYNPTPNNQYPNSIPNNQYPNSVPNNQYPNSVPNNQYPNLVPNNQYPNSVPNNQYPNSVPNNQYPNSVPTNQYPNSVPTNQYNVTPNRQYIHNIPQNIPATNQNIQIMSQNNQYNNSPSSVTNGLNNNLNQYLHNSLNHQQEYKPVDDLNQNSVSINPRPEYKNPPISNIELQQYQGSR